MRRARWHGAVWLKSWSPPFREVVAAVVSASHVALCISHLARRRTSHPLAPRTLHLAPTHLAPRTSIRTSHLAPRTSHLAPRTSHLAPRTAGRCKVHPAILRADVFPRSDHREVQDSVDDRQRRIRHRLPRGRHLDRQEGRAQGAAQAGRRLRRAAARAAAARQPQPPEHRHDPDGGEAGERLLHRDGVRAGRDARERSSRATARSTSRARSTTPARSATPSITPTARACCTAICGRRTCSSPTAAW